MMQTYLEDTEPIQRRLTVGEVDVLCQPERVESEVAYHGPVQRGGALKERQRLALRHHNGARRRGGCVLRGCLHAERSTRHGDEGLGPSTAHSKHSERLHGICVVRVYVLEINDPGRQISSRELARAKRKVRSLRELA